MDYNARWATYVKMPDGKWQCVLVSGFGFEKIA